MSDLFYEENKEGKEHKKRQHNFPGRNGKVGFVQANIEMIAEEGPAKNKDGDQYGSIQNYA
jgi:hypothetical protein